MNIEILSPVCILHLWPLCEAASGSVPPHRYWQVFSISKMFPLPNTFSYHLPFLVASTAKHLERTAYVWYLYLLTSHLFLNPPHLSNSPHQVINNFLIPKSMDISFLFLMDFQIIWCYWSLLPGNSPVFQSPISSYFSAQVLLLLPSLEPLLALPQRSLLRPSPPTLRGSLAKP